MHTRLALESVGLEEAEMLDDDTERAKRGESV